MSQTDILIRAFEPEDLPDLTEAWAQPLAVRGTLQLPHVSLADRRKRAERSGPNLLHLVAVIDGKAIGMITLIREETRRAHVASIGIAVHDAYAGRGAGTALMAAAIDIADNWLALKRLELNVYSDNARAIALYQRFGFEREGLFRNYAFRDGEYVDSVAMARLQF